MSVRENLEKIRKNLAGKKVAIVGVTKGQPIEKIREAFEAGLKDFGNNYAQEGAEVRQAIPGGHWHFIGHLQSRKVKEVLDYHLIQSLDRVEIAKALHERLEKLDRSIDALIEVNLGEEASKSGIPPESVQDFLRALRPYSRVRVRGIMVLPPPLLPVERRRAFFKSAKGIFEAHAALGWDCLSMGTSEDYLVAVSEGATMVRLGTILFCARA